MDPNTIQATVETPAADNTAGAALPVVIPTTSRTSNPNASAMSLYAGHGTPAMDTCVSLEASAERHCSTLVIHSTITLN